MADVLLQAVFDQKKREFRTQGASSDRFEDDFLDAANRIINMINIKADLDTAISDVNNIDDPVVGLDQSFEQVLSAGITSELSTMGHRVAKGFEGQLASAGRRFNDGITAMFYKLTNDRQDADDEDDIIGLPNTQD